MRPYAPFILFMAAITSFADLKDALAQAKPGETPIMLRISKQLVEELTDDEIEVEMPVSDEFVGIPISGTAMARAKVQIRFETSNSNATIYLTATGKGHSTFGGTAGPVTARGQAWVPFTLKTHVTFDGIKYKSHPATSEATVDSQIDEVCTSRNGPLAKVIRHIAWNKLSEAKPDMDAYLLARAKRGLESAMADVARFIEEDGVCDFPLGLELLVDVDAVARLAISA